MTLFATDAEHEIYQQEVKDWVSTFVAQGVKFPARLDLFSLKNKIATIICPPYDSESMESIWGRTAFAASHMGATHVSFVHPAEIGISTSMSSAEMNSIDTTCLCMYLCTTVTITPFVFPYSFSEETGVISWQDNASEQAPLAQMDFLRTYLSLAAANSNMTVRPETYLSWLLDNKYQVEFYEPFSADNFGYIVSPHC